MTTRAARIWNGTAWEDLAAPVGVAPVSYQSTQPSSPQTGDIWIDSSTNTASSGIPVNYQATAPVNPSVGTIWIESDIDVPSVGQNLSYRWRRIAAGGETTLSGNDSFGLPLNYTPNYEQFFLNGMLLYRDSDYTASTGTTITGFPALTAGDVVEVLAIRAEPLADTYTQAQADSKYQLKTKFNSLKRVAGNFTYANTNWVAISGIDISIPASAGDLVTWSMRFLTTGTQSGSTAFYQLDGGVLNNTSIVRYLWGALGGSAYGGWGPDGYAYSDGPKEIKMSTVVQSGDLFNGTFTVRPHIRQFGASSVTLYADSSYPMWIDIINHGQAA